MIWQLWRRRAPTHYVLRLPIVADMFPSAVAYEILKRFTPVIRERDFRRLPEELKHYFTEVQE